MKIKAKSKKTPVGSIDADNFEETNTSEIKDYIKQLGLDSFSHETLDGIGVVKKKKGKTKSSGTSKNDGDAQTSKRDSNQIKSDNSSSLEKKNRKKGLSNGKPKNNEHAPSNKKEIHQNVTNKGNNLAKKNNERFNKNDSTNSTSKAVKKYQPRSNSSDIPAATKSLPNKKITFDDTGTPVAAAGNSASKPNKKIVFDESYILNQKNDSGHAGSQAQQSAWYNLLIAPDEAWYTQGVKLEPSTQYVSGPELKKAEEEGQNLLENDVANYKKVREVGSEKAEIRWLNTVLKGGAFADKIAAHTILLQESTPHNLPSLRFLISLLNVKGRRECLASLDALLKLMTEGKILNPSAKLVPFTKRPLAALYKLAERDRHKMLALWYFENQLKELYNQMLTAMDELLKDAVEATRRKAIVVLSQLLMYSPEQEQSLLARLVNKIGDPTRTVATSAVTQLERVLQTHPNMKTVVISEVERLLYRPNVSPKTQYYGLCFLSQVLLDSEDFQLANKLIIIYVSFFKACVKKGEVDSKLMAALLTGVKRAFPFTQNNSSGSNPLDSHVDTLFKLVHMVRFGLAIQVLCVLDQVVGTGQGNSDRFYSVLFRKLLDPDLIHSTKHCMFLNMLFQAVKRDDAVDRQRAFIKRILQVSLTCPPPLACGFLYLVSEILKLKPELKSFRQGVSKFLDDDDEDEHYEDADGELALEDAAKKSDDSDAGKSAPSTWIHRNLNRSNQQKDSRKYDPLARNPTYARAELSGGFWELNLLAEHNHPSVSLFAKTIVEGSFVEYSGDPLQDFTLIRFLDRFVFRNPKKISRSQTKPTALRRVMGKRKLYVPAGARALDVNSREFLNQPSGAVPPEEVFLYQYFKRRASRKELTEDDDIESVASEDFDEYLARGSDLDFASEIKPKTKQKKDKRDAENDEEGDGLDDSDLNEAEVDSSEEDFDQDEEFQDAFKDFDDMLNEDETTGEPVPDDASDEVEDGDGEEDEEEEDEDDDDDEGDDDDEPEFREEDVEFSDGDEAGEMGQGSKPSGKGSKKRSVDDEDDLDLAFGVGSIKRKKNRAFFSDSGSDFAAAEEFAALLEESGQPDLNIGGTSEELANKDRASVKQLQWEMARDRWMKNLNRPRRGAKTNKSSSAKRRPDSKSKFSTAKRRPGGGKRGGKR